MSNLAAETEPRHSRQHAIAARIFWTPELCERLALTSLRAAEPATSAGRSISPFRTKISQPIKLRWVPERLMRFEHIEIVTL
jgi:hypothetical protein